jgi:RHS repeat-associated protein
VRRIWLMPVAAQSSACPEGGIASYYRARYYDPAAGRFVAEDPMSFKGGINFYPYVKNSAVNWRDPDGRGPDAGTLAGIWNHAVGALNWIQCSITATYCLSGFQAGVDALANMANFKAEPSHTYDALANTAAATHQATASNVYLNQFCAANPGCMVAFESCLQAGLANPLPTPTPPVSWPSARPAPRSAR